METPGALGVATAAAAAARADDGAGGASLCGQYQLEKFSGAGWRRSKTSRV
eukprot:COSAG01_NODE_1173_length_11400_cov_2.767366_6_plen_51_part_00